MVDWLSHLLDLKLYISEELDPKIELNDRNP